MRAASFRERTMTTICPHCHQPIGTMRLGVRLTPLKASIVDRIKAAGDVGISSEELMFTLWERDAVCVDTVKAHVWQINEVLEETDWAVRSDGRRWFLSRRPA
jgi:hypothetical protein